MVSANMQPPSPPTWVILMIVNDACLNWIWNFAEFNMWRCAVHGYSSSISPLIEINGDKNNSVPIISQYNVPFIETPTLGSNKTKKCQRNQTDICFLAVPTHPGT